METAYPNVVEGKCEPTGRVYSKEAAIKDGIVKFDNDIDKMKFLLKGEKHIYVDELENRINDNPEKILKISHFHNNHKYSVYYNQTLLKIQKVNTQNRKEKTIISEKEFLSEAPLFADRISKYTSVIKESNKVKEPVSHTRLDACIRESIKEAASRNTQHKTNTIKKEKNIR